jgi:excisionase family DNA binding protein
MRRSRETRQDLTTFEVARLLGVSADTVASWVDRGWLEAHRTPGGHRRIGPEALARFAEAHRIPLAQASPVDAAPAPARPATRPSVLVVDDDQDFGETIREYLSRKHRWEVFVVTDALAACMSAARQSPRAILVDLALPVTDGFALLGALRADPLLADVGIFAVTGWRDAALERRARAAAFAGFFAKPLDLAELGAALVPWMREAR